MIKNHLLLIFSLLLILSCFNEPKLAKFEPNELAIEKIGWQCHRTIKVVKDTNTLQHLSITTHSPKVTYPGISLPWLKGDISNIDTITILFNNPDSTKKFELFLWDQVGSLYYENRFNMTFMYKKGTVDTIIIPLNNGLKTISGRMINLKNIQTAVLYTSQSKIPFTFDLFDIILKPKSLSLI